MLFISKNNFIKLLSLFFLGLLLSAQCLGQKKINIKSVIGTAYVTDNITLKQAKNNALQDAKEKALRKAGIKEDITLTNVLNTSQVQNVVQQNFVEISTSSLNGAVLNYSILNEKRSVDRFNNFKIVLTIDATVIKYKEKKDPSFVFKVSGIKDIYYAGDSLSFFFKPYENGYLKIFLISNDTAQIIYPYTNSENALYGDVQDLLFKRNIAVKFPILKYIKYSLISKKNVEFNQLIFVFLKKNIPFSEKVTTKSIHKWIYSVPPNLRAIGNKIFTLENKNAQP